MIQFLPIGPTSLGLILDAVGVVILSYVLFRTTLRLHRSVEETIADTRYLLARRAVECSNDFGEEMQERLQANVPALREKGRYVFLHLSIAVVGALFLICGLASQLSGSWLD